MLTLELALIELNSETMNDNHEEDQKTNCPQIKPSNDTHTETHTLTEIGLLCPVICTAKLVLAVKKPWQKAGNPSVYSQDWLVLSVQHSPQSQYS